MKTILALGMAAVTICAGGSIAVTPARAQAIGSCSNIRTGGAAASACPEPDDKQHTGGPNSDACGANCRGTQPEASPPPPQTYRPQSAGSPERAPRTNTYDPPTHLPDVANDPRSTRQDKSGF